MFQAPQEPDAWSSPYEAFEPGNACIQAQSLIVNFTHDGWTRYSEDCLHMDIYAAQVSEPHNKVTKLSKVTGVILKLTH